MAIKRDGIILSVMALAVLLGFGAFRFFRNSRAESVRAEVPVYVSTVRPEKADISERLVLPAFLETERMVSVIPRVAGPLIEVLVEEGAAVSKGQLLARIDSEPYLLELRAAESSWLLARSSLERVKRLYEGAGASRQQLDEAQASHDAAYSSYELARMRLGYAEIESPISGTVLASYGETGNLVSMSSPLFLVGDTGEPRADVRVPEKHWDKFLSPDSVRVIMRRSPDDEGSALNGFVLRVSPSISPADKTFGVVCVPETPDGGIIWPVGTRLDVEFVINEKVDAWSLPAGALAGDGVFWRVDNSVVSRLDPGGLFGDGRRIMIPAEWADGLFVLDGHHRLRNGQTVVAVASGEF